MICHIHLFDDEDCSPFMMRFICFLLLYLQGQHHFRDVEDLVWLRHWFGKTDEGMFFSWAQHNECLGSNFSTCSVLYFEVRIQCHKMDKNRMKWNVKKISIGARSYLLPILKNISKKNNKKQLNSPKEMNKHKQSRKYNCNKRQGSSDMLPSGHSLPNRLRKPFGWFTWQ